jgi:hypothetical protein
MPVRLVKDDDLIKIRIALQYGVAPRRDSAGEKRPGEIPADIPDHGSGKQNISQPIYIKDEYLLRIAVFHIYLLRNEL